MEYALLPLTSSSRNRVKDRVQSESKINILTIPSCSLFRLLLRVLSQFMFLTPKPNFIPPIPKHQPYAGAIFIPFLICVFLHTFTARPEAGEAMRGYLHGGVIIDLIGQKGPTSKFHLVGLDILVAALQCFMLAVHVERERLVGMLASLVSPSTTAASVTAANPAANTAVPAAGEQPRGELETAQDHDAEERGVARDGVTNNGDIELRNMSSSSGNHEANVERDEARERLLAEPAPRQDAEDDDTTGIDAFWSGTAIVADFHVLHTLRKQWDAYGPSAGALQTVGYSAALANGRLNAASTRFR